MGGGGRGAWIPLPPAVLEWRLISCSSLEEDPLARGSAKRGRDGPFPPAEEIFRAFLEIRERLGDLGFGPGRFQEYLEALLPPGGRKEERPFSRERLEDLYLCLGLLLGSERAFRYFEKEYALRFFRAAAGAGFPGEEARDAYQEVLGEIWRGPGKKGSSLLDGYLGRGSLFGFLKTVFLRKLIRREAARSRLAPLEGEELLPGGGPDPGSLAEVRELEALFRDLVGGALDRLPPTWRTFLLAVHREGLPSTKAAVETGLLPEGTPHLRTRASRIHAKAMKAFRAALLERARRVYGLDSREIEGLLGKEPLHRPWKGHQGGGGPGRASGTEGLDSHG